MVTIAAMKTDVSMLPPNKNLKTTDKPTFTKSGQATADEVVGETLEGLC